MLIVCGVQKASIENWKNEWVYKVFLVWKPDDMIFIHVHYQSEHKEQVPLKIWLLLDSKVVVCV